MSRCILVIFYNVLFIDTIVNSTVNCTYGDVRLMGGSTEYEGRLEVCINGEWGTVCDHNWGYVDARVVCRHLGYAIYNTKLLQCSSRPIGSHRCSHSDEAGVKCEGNEFLTFHFLC